MAYDIALDKAWQELQSSTKQVSYSVQFLSDTYSVDIANKRILSLSCNAPAKTHTSILILHYLLKKIKGLPQLCDKWISFKELDGGEIYYPTYRKRVIDTVLRKYKTNPEALLALKERFKTKEIKLADIGIALETFEGVPLLITFWKSDDEFSPEANVLFDENIKNIFCTEDIVVLAETVVRSI